MLSIKTQMAESHTSSSYGDNTCLNLHPYLALFVKQNLFQWDENQMKGNHAVPLQLLIVQPPPCTIFFIDCEPQTRQMLRLS